MCFVFLFSSLLWRQMKVEYLLWIIILIVHGHLSPISRRGFALTFCGCEDFYKWKNGGFFFSFSWATMTKMEVSGHWHAQKQTSFVPWAWKPLFKQDTSTLLTGCKAVVSLQDYFCFYTFFAWEPGSFLKLDPIFLFSSVGLTDPLRWC